MFRTPRAGTALVAILLLSPAARPQPPDAATTREPLTLPTDREAGRRLEAVRDYVRTAAWPEAARLVQRLLDAPEDSLVRLDEAHGPRWVSVRAEAERLLTEMPAAGREAYQTFSSGPAARMLGDARKRGDSKTLQE